MGTAWHEIQTVSVGFSRADGSAPDTARAAVLYGAQGTQSARTGQLGLTAVILKSSVENIELQTRKRKTHGNLFRRKYRGGNQRKEKTNAAYKILQNIR
jgi:hypothetical protein